MLHFFKSNFKNLVLLITFNKKIFKKVSKKNINKYYKN